MFDMGFLELLLISIIALIVLGPERLPKAARTLGLWIGKAKQSFESIKNEIDRELKVKELQQQIEEQKIKLESDAGINELKDGLENTVNSINSETSGIKNEFSVNSAEITEQEPGDNANAISSKAENENTPEELGKP